MPAPTNPRQLLVNLLTGYIVPAGSWEVRKYARAIDPPPKPVAMLRLDGIGPGAEQGTRLYRYGVVVITAKQSGEGAGDDELEDVVEDVLLALSKAADGLAIVVGDGKRGVYADTMPAFDIAIEVKVAVS